MKNTFIPLDILFLDKHKKVIGLFRKYDYAIETNAGTIKNNNIKLNDIIEFIY